MRARRLFALILAAGALYMALHYDPQAREREARLCLEADSSIPQGGW